MNAPYLQTTRLDLYQLSADNGERLFLDLDSDPEVMTYINGGQPSTVEEARAAVTRVLGLYAKHRNRFGVWPAFERGTGAYIGWALLRPCKKNPDNERLVEVGYRLKKSAWGKGYATEMARALVRKAFTELGVDEVFAVAMEKNLASQAVMKKTGLIFHSHHEEEQFPEGNRWAARYTLRRADWIPS